MARRVGSSNVVTPLPAGQGDCKQRRHQSRYERPSQTCDKVGRLPSARRPVRNLAPPASCLQKPPECSALGAKHQAVARHTGYYSVKPGAPQSLLFAFGLEGCELRTPTLYRTVDHTCMDLGPALTHWRACMCPVAPMLVHGPSIASQLRTNVWSTATDFDAPTF